MTLSTLLTLYARNTSSWHGNAFRITGPLWGEYTVMAWKRFRHQLSFIRDSIGDRYLQNPLGPMWRLDVFFFVVDLNKNLKERSSCQWFDTHRCSRRVTVIITLDKQMIKQWIYLNFIKSTLLVQVMACCLLSVMPLSETVLDYLSIGLLVTNPKPLLLKITLLSKYIERSQFIRNRHHTRQVMMEVTSTSLLVHDFRIKYKHMLSIASLVAGIFDVKFQLAFNPDIKLTRTCP